MFDERTIPFRIGSNDLPGLSKLVEEAGEVNQIIGKIIDLGSMGLHWDGTNLEDELCKELGDLAAAIKFVAEINGLNEDWIALRANKKLARFHQWHDNTQAGKDPNDGVEYDEDERAPTCV